MATKKSTLTTRMNAIEPIVAAHTAEIDTLKARVAKLEQGPPAPTPPPPSPPTAPTTFYVSTSGSDSNDGLSEASPKRTPRDVYEMLVPGGAMLLKRGDAWNDPGTPFAFVGGGGKSNIRIGAYGDGPRPVLVCGTFRPLDGDHDIVIEDLEFRFGPRSMTSFAVQWQLAVVKNVTIRRCRFFGYVDNIHVVGDADHRSENVLIEDCVIADAGAQGVLIGDVDGLVIRGCVFDRNGWSPTSPDSPFNHNVYLTHTNGPVVFEGNISARASSHGLQQRPGGTCRGNLFLANPIGIFLAGDGIVEGNVVIESRDMHDQPRGQGIWNDYCGDQIVRDNIVAFNRGASDSWGITMSNPKSGKTQRVENNIVYAWDSPHENSAPIGLYFPSQPLGTIVVKSNVIANTDGYAVELDFSHDASVYQFSGNAYRPPSFYNGGSVGIVPPWGEIPEVDPIYPDPSAALFDIDAYMAEALEGRQTAAATIAAVRSGFGR